MSTCLVDLDVTGLDLTALRELVRATYEQVAQDPRGDFHFHRGARYAVDVLGYDAGELAGLPAIATERFAGVGNPLAVGPIHEGETVLDHACGAGTDLLLAARRVGPRGRVLGVDMTPAMRACARQAADEAGLGGIIEIRAGLFEDLPVEDASVDVVLSNGVVNLAPDKRRVLAEVARVLRPGGRLYLADVTVARRWSAEVGGSVELWAACIAGALPARELLELVAGAGLVDARVIAEVEAFRATSAEQRVREDMRIRGTSFVARRPAATEVRS
jgi:SAM-dependent methyltransferase